MVKFYIKDYFLSAPRGQSLTAYLGVESPHCVDIFTFSNKAPDLLKSFQVTLVDQRLALITDEAKRERHQLLNIIEPHTYTLTIVIEDDDGMFIVMLIKFRKSIRKFI